LIHRGAVKPPISLVPIGPIINVRFCLPETDAQMRRAVGLPVPDPIAGAILVDTGAEGTHVADDIPQRLGLVPIRFQKVVGVNLIPEDRPVYRMALRLTMEESSGRTLDTIYDADMIGSPGMIPNQAGPLVGLLGRDFLRFVDFHYHGPLGTFEIVFQGQVPQRPSVHAGASGDVAKKRGLRRQKRASRKANRSRSR